MAFKTSNLEELIFSLRVQIGDTGTTPTYSDEELHAFLREAVLALMSRWSDKYYLDSDGVVTRNPDVTFKWSSPPVIQQSDRRAIVLQSSIMIKGGKKFSESGNVQSWRDEEISYSNIEAARQLSSTVEEDRLELDSILPKPQKKLARPIMDRLYGGLVREWDL